MPTSQTRDRRREVWTIALLLILSYGLFFYQSGARYIWEPDEDEYALVNREMVEEGHWIYPTFNGWPYSVKPPLYNWIGSAISLIGGEVTEASSRLPSALFATAGIVMIFLLGALLFGYRAGLLTAVVLATTPQYFYQARWIQIHLPGTVLLVATILCFYWGYTNEKRRPLAYLLMYIPVGVGTLLTGPVSGVMPVIIIGGYLLANHDFKHILRMRLGWGILIYLLIAAPWFIAVSMREEYGQILLVTTNLTRYLKTFVHEEPFYYYFVRTPRWWLPWFLVLPGLAVAWFKHLDREERKALLLPLIWAVGLLLFFSISRTKRTVYMITAAPAMALMVGAGIAWAMARFQESLFWRRFFTWPMGLLAGTLAVSALGLPVFTWFRAPDWFPTALPIALMAALAVVGMTLFLVRKEHAAVMATLILLFTGTVAYSAHAVVAKMNDAKSPRAFSHHINTIIPEGEPLRMFAFFRPGYGYYTHRRIAYTHKTNDLEKMFVGGDRVFVVTKEEIYLQLKKTFPLPIHELYRREIDGRDIILFSNKPGA